MNERKDIEKVFKILDNEEKMRVIVFTKKGNKPLLEQKVAEIKTVRNFIRDLLDDIKKVAKFDEDKVFLGGRVTSWDTLFEVIRSSELQNLKGNFWAFVQYLESQLDIKKSFCKDGK